MFRPLRCTRVQRWGTSPGARDWPGASAAKPPTSTASLWRRKTSRRESSSPAPATGATASSCSSSTASGTCPWWRRVNGVTAAPPRPPSLRCPSRGTGWATSPKWFLTERGTGTACPRFSAFSTLSRWTPAASYQAAMCSASTGTTGSRRRGTACAAWWQQHTQQHPDAWKK